MPLPMYGMGVAMVLMAVTEVLLGFFVLGRSSRRVRQKVRFFSMFSVK